MVVKWLYYVCCTSEFFEEGFQLIKAYHDYSHIRLGFEANFNLQKNGVVLYVRILCKLFYYDKGCKVLTRG